MTVEETKRGLRVMTVYKGSPASEGGLKSGDIITKVNGRSIAGNSSEASTARIKGPAGTSVTLTVRRRRARARAQAQARAGGHPGRASPRWRRSEGARSATSTSPGFTSGAHGEVSPGGAQAAATTGADGIVLDLRDNGGGLLNEAVLVSSIFIPDGKIVSTKGRSRPEQVYDATGGAIPGDVPVAVLVNRNSASASEIVTGALQDRKRATVVGTRTFGKGVFQEIEQLSNGGALDITVGEYFLPSGRNIGGGGVAKGDGITPDVKAYDNPKTKPDEALDAAEKVVLRNGT